MLHFMTNILWCFTEGSGSFLVERSRGAQECVTPVEGGLLYTDIMGVGLDFYTDFMCIKRPNVTVALPAKRVVEPQLSPSQI